MTPAQQCAFEDEVMAAAMQSRWPDRVPADLRAHVESCVLCRDLAEVAGSIAAAGELARDEAALPEAGRVWWMCHMRARREAIKTAGRPITAVQVAALGCAAGVAGACFGASSSWFQSTLQWLGTKSDAFTSSVLPLVLGALVDHRVLAIAALAMLIGLPALVLLALGRD